MGSCGALAGGLDLGDADRGRRGDLRGRRVAGARGADVVAADPLLTQSLAACLPGAAVGAVVSVDLFYEEGPPGGGREALAVEMEAAALFAVGRAAGTAVGCVLAVSDTFDADGTRHRIGDEELLEAAQLMGAAAIAALSP